MDNAVKKKNTLLILIAAMSTGIVLSIESVMTPTISMLYTMFPNDAGLLNFSVTGSYIFGVIGSLSIVALTKRFGDRAVLIFSTAIGTLGGILWYVQITPMMMAIGRSLTQITYPIVNVLAINVINNLYDDVAARGRAQGIFNAFKSIVMSVLSIVAGFLAVNSLRGAYSLNLLPIISVILLVLFLPKNKADTAQEASDQEAAAQVSSKGYGVTFWLFTVSYFLMTMGFCSVMYYGSMYVEENGLGTAALAGTIMSAGSLASFFASLIFGWIVVRLKKATLWISAAMCLSGVVLLWAAPSLFAAYVGMIIPQVGCSLYNCYTFSYITMFTPEDRATGALGLIQTFSIAAVMVVSYLVTFSMEIFQFATFTEFLVVSVVILTVSVLLGILAMNTSRAKEVSL